MKGVLFAVAIVCVTSVRLLAADEWPPVSDPLLRTVDLNVGESSTVKLSDGTEAKVKLVDLSESRDDICNAVREARVTVEVNGQRGTLTTANYRLPVVLGGVQIDCAVTKGYVQPKENPWALQKSARLRFWPSGSPWIQPDTFMYPVNQRWFATATQMANEPTYVDACEKPGVRNNIYYHEGLDVGGADARAEIVAATDGVAVLVGDNTIQPPDFPRDVKPRYDVVYLLDGRGWYYRYSHLDSIDPAVKVGARVKMGQKIGVLGKEGGSGGWSHLHFGITGRQPSGKYGTIEGYAFLWQAYHTAHKTRLQAVARPHRVAWVGEEVALDGSRSWSVHGPGHITGYQWLFTDGTTADGAQVRRSYPRPGKYGELLKVTDADGRVDYDVCPVEVFSREHPDLLPASIHATYWPTFDVKAGDEMTFLVRSFGISRAEGHERWDFGDGSPAVEVQSDDAKKDIHAKDGYVTTTHRYAKAGHYVVSVSRTNGRSETATARLHVHIK